MTSPVGSVNVGSNYFIMVAGWQEFVNAPARKGGIDKTCSMESTRFFDVTAECLRLGLRAGAIVFRNVRVGTRSPALHAEIVAEVRKIRARFRDSTDVRDLPEVAAFRAISAKVGVKPRDAQPSVERLLSFVLKRGDLPPINSLVDAYNLISVRTFCSLGAHDLDTVAPPIRLQTLSGKESFTPLGKTAPRSVAAGEFGYVDAAGRVVCWLDVLQADFSKVTPATVNALLIVEGTTAHSEHIDAAASMAVELITRHCGGTAEVVAMP
jgi:DNA/RNA-binding domain of Phe-tRNA-synthetase-like protein